ncbi:MAG: outer membrane beta-barrel protein [Gammaproteobacteria bacterium]|nr:outer membrane beta-barrel protein [Gammaproteobacteria bacterium]MYF29507.1 outer membrane beta-barrel protein [Gammaproteobacteria bacterium]MYK46946.1 outer membrane beta-barrel protein [Gammaproteobacteria bacterium]
MRRSGIILALALTASATAQGGLPDITYDGVSAGYTRTDLDGAGEDANSFTWSASYELSDRFHLWGSIDRTTYEETIAVPQIVPSDFGDLPFPPDFEFPLLEIPPLEVSVRTMGVAAGAGVHGDLTDRLSGHARIGFGYANTEIESSGFDLAFPPGLNPIGIGQVQLIETPDRVDETSTDLVMSAGLRFNAAERVELFGGISQVGGDDTAAHAGVEFRLGAGWGVQLAGITGENSQGLSANVVWRF